MHTVMNDMPDRLRAAAAEVRDTKEPHTDALERRDELIETAVDNGMSQRQVAHLTGLTSARVTAILAKRALLD